MFITPSPVFDASVSGGTDNLCNLPEWDLNDLYQGTDDPKIEQDLAWLETECAAFAADYEGKLADLNTIEMLTCIHRNEKISSVAGRIMSFAGLRYYQLTTDGERTKFL
ncbi:MAG: oligoendopeptidase F, partial [Paracoccaceae bacterium]